MCTHFIISLILFCVYHITGKMTAEGEDNDGSDSGIQEPAGARDKKKGRKSFTRHDLKGCTAFFQQLDALLQLGHGDSDHWTASAMQEVSAITGSSAPAAGGKAVPLLVTPPPASSVHTSAAMQQSLVQRFRSIASLLTASVMKQYEGSMREIQQVFEQANQALLASFRLDRQESINIDETHFAKSPGVKQSSSSLSPSTSRTSSVGSSGSSLSREMPARLEVPLLHQRMKHLVATMEKFVPHGGLALLLIQ